MQNSKTNKTSLFALGAMLILANSVMADNYTIFNTGIDNLAASLSFGSVDPHWTGTSIPDGSGPAAYVPISQSSHWHPGTPTAEWLAPSVDQGLPGRGC